MIRILFYHITDKVLIFIINFDFIWKMHFKFLTPEIHFWFQNFSVFNIRVCIWSFTRYCNRIIKQKFWNLRVRNLIPLTQYRIWILIEFCILRLSKPSWACKEMVLCVLDWFFLYIKEKILCRNNIFFLLWSIIEIKDFLMTSWFYSLIQFFRCGYDCILIFRAVFDNTVCNFYNWIIPCQFII